MQARKNIRRIAFAVVAAAAAIGVGLAASPSTATARDCTPTCFKNPITGQITCTYPCP